MIKPQPFKPFLEIFIPVFRGSEGAGVAMGIKMYMFWNQVMEVNKKYAREYLP